MNNEEELFNILNLKNRFICNNLMHNISIDAYKTGKVEMTTLYEILNNDKYISNYNIADDIYNNIACQNLEYSHKIVTCLENILKIKDELEQIWSNFKNNEK